MYIICLNQEKEKWSDNEKKTEKKNINHDTKKYCRLLLYFVLYIIGSINVFVKKRYVQSS